MKPDYYDQDQLNNPDPTLSPTFNMPNPAYNVPNLTDPDPSSYMNFNNISAYYSLDEYQGPAPAPVLKLCELCGMKFEYEVLSEHQKKCSEIFLDEEQINKTVMTKCNFCGEQYDLSAPQKHKQTCLMEDIKCQYCYEPMLRVEYQEHTAGCKGFQQPCKQCGQIYDIREQSSHQCIVKQMIKEQMEPEQMNAICMWCMQKIEPHLSHVDHQTMCEIYIEHLQNMQKMRYSEPLTNLQVNTLDYLYRKSAEMNVHYLDDMKIIIQNAGLDADSLPRITKYIAEEAPIIIHFNMSRSIHAYLLDHRYRNLFETNTSGGSKSRVNRIKWEGYLFDERYSFAEDEERIKYGVMNFVNDVKGIKSCSGYGSSFMVLNKNVRRRCTITNKRKYGPGQLVTTLNYCYPVLAGFDKKQLQAANIAAQGYSLQSKDLTYFKEVHIHGPISFIQDVECIYAPQSEIVNNQWAVQQFNELFGVSVYPICEV